MENLSLSVTNSLSNIHTIYNYYTKKYNEIKSLYEKICSIKKDKDDYGPTVRKQVDKYCKTFNKEYSRFLDIHDMFIKDIKIIHNNSSDDRVLYNVDKYREYAEELDKFNKKKLTELIDDLEDDAKIYMYDSNYVLSSNTHKLYSELNKVESLVKTDLIYLNKFNKKNKDKE